MVNLFLIAALIVGILFPGYAILNGSKTRRFLLANTEMKIYVFQQTALFLILLVVISIVPFVINDTTLDLIGLKFIRNPLQVTGLFIISLIGLFIISMVKLSEHSAQKIYKANKRVYFLMPSAVKEYRLTIVVSFIAGICEEIIYRGFLFWFLSNYMSIIPAMLLANIPFALAHLTTTGKRNTLGVFLLAFIFSGAYYVTGSLWLPILLHILIDLYSMTFAYKSNQILNALSQNDDMKIEKETNKLS